MIDFSQFDTTFLTTSIVLITMGCISIVLSLILHRKMRALEKLPKNLKTKVFNKTFNVFDPYPPHRKSISNHIEILIILACYVFFIFIAIAIAKMLELGRVLSFATFIICLSLLMTDETLELHKNANIFIRAIEKKVNLGKGDLDALHVIKETMPQLGKYYRLLAIAFFAFSIVVPYIVTMFLLILSQFASGLITVTYALQSIPHITILIVILSFSFVAITVKFATSLVKKKLFGFPASEPIDTLGWQFLRMKLFVHILHHHPYLRVPEPDKPQKAEEKV